MGIIRDGVIDAVCTSFFLLGIASSGAWVDLINPRICFENFQVEVLPDRLCTAHTRLVV